MLIFRKFLYCLFKGLSNTIDHDGIEHAGYMAFMTLLSFFPFIIFIIALTGFAGESKIGTEFVSFLVTNLPYDLTSALKPRIQEILNGPPQSLVTFAIIGIIWTASSSVEGLRTILNRVYMVSTPPTYLLRRLLSIAQFFCFTAIIVLSLFFLLFLPNLLDFMETMFNNSEILNRFLNLSIVKDIFLLSVHTFWIEIRYASLLITLFLVICSIYYILPNVKLKFKSVMPGALIVIILWHLCGKLLNYYFHQFQQTSLIYGSLASVIASLLFFFFINMIFIYGAEFNFLFSESKHLNGKMRRFFS